MNTKTVCGLIPQTSHVSLYVLGLYQNFKLCIFRNDFWLLQPLLELVPDTSKLPLHRNWQARSIFAMPIRKSALEVSGFAYEEDELPESWFPESSTAGSSTRGNDAKRRKTHSSPEARVSVQCLFVAWGPIRDLATLSTIITRTRIPVVSPTRRMLYLI